MENLTMKDLQEALSAVSGEIKGAVEKANAEAADAKSVSAESKSAIDSLIEKSDAIEARINDMESAAAAMGEQEAKAADFGEFIIKSDEFAALQSGRQRSARIELKTALVNATGSDQPLVDGDRLGGVYMQTPERDLTIRDILPKFTTSSNLVEFTQESSFTNNAGPQVGNSPEEFENVTKPESAFAFALASQRVETLAHTLPVSKQVMADAPMLQGYLTGRMAYGLKLVEETQILSGSGANGNLNGLITQASAYVPESPELANEIDIIRDAMTQCFSGDYRPNFIVLNHADWADVERKKVGASREDYVIGDPRGRLAPTLWGLPVVATNSISAGTFLLGDTRAAGLFDRQQAAVEFSYEDGDNFKRNMVTIRAEERLALCVFNTSAFVTGSL